MSDAALVGARQALEAGRPGEALELVAEAWRARRSPRLAEVARVLALRRPTPLSEQLAAVVGRAAASSHQRLLALREIDHPLVANFVLAQLLTPRFVGSSPFLLELINLGLRLRDTRLAAQAQLIASVLEERLTQRAAMPLVAALMNGVAGLPPAPPPDALELELEVALARPVDLDALLRDVQAHPDDVARRLVLADLLLERNDPRGEFIQLQCRGEDAARQQALLRKHARQWLGALAPVVRWSKHAATRFERGFLAVAETTFARVALLAAARDPAWATVEVIKPRVPDELLFDAPLNALRRVDLFDAMVRRLVARGRRLPAVEELTLACADPDWPSTAQAVAQLCPRLRVLHVTPYEGFDALRPLREPVGALARLVITGLWPAPTHDETFAAVVEGVRRSPAGTPEVEVARRLDHRPPQERLVFRAVKGGYEECRTPQG